MRPIDLPQYFFLLISDIFCKQNFRLRLRLKRQVELFIDGLIDKRIDAEGVDGFVFVAVRCELFFAVIGELLVLEALKLSGLLELRRWLRGVFGQTRW